MIKRIMAAVAASVAIASPSLAKVDSGTVSLLTTAQQYGIRVQYNPPRCNGANYHGSYIPAIRTIALCYKGTPTAEDHNTVRHEMWHAVQHCGGLRRGFDGVLPLSNNTTLRTRWVAQYLRTTDINRIKSLYPRAVHDTELEAFAAAQHYSASQIEGVLRKWCIKR